MGFAFVGLMLSVSVAFAQQPEQGGHEVQIWTGGGHSVPGGTANTGIWNLGIRYGWVLTGPHGPGFLKGSFEYAIDAVPVFLVFQPANTAFGAGFNPLGLKWNFEPHGAITPYAELGGGTLFTNHDVPNNTSTVNFTTTGAVGMHIGRGSHNVSVDVRFMHISNAGLANLNPGINTVQVRLGFGLFRK
jgi:lipid A 3-O-deacylase